MGFPPVLHITMLSNSTSSLWSRGDRFFLTLLGCLSSWWESLQAQTGFPPTVPISLVFGPNVLAHNWFRFHIQCGCSRINSYNILIFHLSLPPQNPRSIRSLPWESVISSHKTISTFFPLPCSMASLWTKLWPCLYPTSNSGSAPSAARKPGDPSFPSPNWWLCNLLSATGFSPSLSTSYFPLACLFQLPVPCVGCLSPYQIMIQHEGLHLCSIIKVCHKTWF